MSFDDEIRQALRSEAARYEPADDGWEGITAGVRTARARRRRLQGGILGVAAALVVTAGIGLSVAEDGTDVTAGPSATDPPATTAPPGAPDATAPGAEPSSTTSPAPATTAPPPTDVAGDPTFPGIWPFASQAAIDRYADGDRRFEDAAATADVFARDYLGMLDPVVDPVTPGGDDEVAVVVRPRGEDGQVVAAGGPSTTVTLRAYATSDGARVWTVVGAASPHVLVDQPMAGAVAGSPLAVRGRATGYEGTVVAQVRQDGMRAGASLGEAVGTAGGPGELGPLSLDVPFRTPTEPAGALVVSTDTGLDGVGVPEATVVRVAFGAAGDRPTADRPPPPAPAACTPPAPATAPAAEEMEVVVYLVCDAAAAGDATIASGEVFVPVTRVVPRTTGVLRTALQALLAGTEPAEAEAGLSSTFSGATGGLLAGVTLTDGTAVVDLAATVDGASTSAGSVLFRGQLDRTVLQFATVERVEYRLGGDCDAFWQWQQVGDCRLVTRDDL
jgi:hypothetical protein